ncbi:hypothetical protein JTB14_008757 [Gonioctena quinquepunctata]|nr:hypothetical protein JTB14_008757 [Gonioctena quinquepunctata]
MGRSTEGEVRVLMTAVISNPVWSAKIQEIQNHAEKNGQKNGSDNSTSRHDCTYNCCTCYCRSFANTNQCEEITTIYQMEHTHKGRKKGSYEEMASNLRALRRANQGFYKIYQKKDG